MQRLNNMKETELRNRIKELKEQLEIERLVSDKIRTFVVKNKNVVEKQAEERDRLRDQKLNELTLDKEDIQQKKEEADKEIQMYQQRCEEEEEDRKHREFKDEENAA